MLHFATSALEKLFWSVLWNFYKTKVFLAQFQYFTEHKEPKWGKCALKVCLNLKLASTTHCEEPIQIAQLGNTNLDCALGEAHINHAPMSDSLDCVLRSTTCIALTIKHT